MTPGFGRSQPYSISAPELAIDSTGGCEFQQHAIGMQRALCESLGATHRDYESAGNPAFVSMITMCQGTQHDHMASGSTPGPTPMDGRVQCFWNNECQDEATCFWKSRKGKRIPVCDSCYSLHKAQSDGAKTHSSQKRTAAEAAFWEEEDARGRILLDELAERQPRQWLTPKSVKKKARNGMAHQ